MQGFCTLLLVKFTLQFLQQRKYIIPVHVLVLNFQRLVQQSERLPKIVLQVRNREFWRALRSARSVEHALGLFWTFSLVNSQIDCICVYGTFGGRLDHVFGNINTLFEADQFTSTNVLQFSDDTVAFLLQKVIITCISLCSLFMIMESVTFINHYFVIVHIT